MLEKSQEDATPPKDYSLANAFSRLGWLGFWAQVAIGAVPVALTIYAFVIGRNVAGGTRGGFVLTDFLTLLGLLVLAFTTVWFYRYTRLALRIADAERRPPQSSIQRAAWTGVAASTIGIVLSILVMLFEVTKLLFYFLRAPQVGIPTIQTTTAGATWVSAADIVSLLVLILTLFIEIIVMTISLWLLFRASTASAEYPNTAT